MCVARHSFFWRSGQSVNETERREKRVVDSCGDFIAHHHAVVPVI
jgi:hypothetical protein